MTRAKRSAVGLKVLIVEDETLVGMGLRAQLEKLGHLVVGQAADSAEAREQFRKESPELVLLDIRLGNEDGIVLANELLKERRCPMIIISAFSDSELIERASASGVFGYLIKPVSDKSLEAQIDVALQRFMDTEQLRADKNKLAQDLENRKVVERAKGILMRRAKLSEEEAHRKLQQESQKRRVGMVELCKRIIESDELMGT